MACPAHPDGHQCTFEGGPHTNHEAWVKPEGTRGMMVYWSDASEIPSAKSSRMMPTTAELMDIVHEVEGEHVDRPLSAEGRELAAELRSKLDIPYHRDGSQTEMDAGERFVTDEVLLADSGAGRALMFMCQMPEVGMTDEEGVAQLVAGGDHSELGSIRRRFTQLRSLGYIAWRPVDFNKTTSKVLYERRKNPGSGGGTANVNYVTEEGLRRGANLVEYKTTHPKIDQ